MSRFYVAIIQLFGKISCMPQLPNLKRIRENYPLTMRELQERSGLSRNAISDLENHNVNARPSTVRKLAEALDVEPRKLIESASEPNHERSS